MMDDFQQRAAVLIAENAPLIKAVADAVHAGPELGFEEFSAAASQIELLKNAGFHVVSPVGSLATAFKAEFGHGSPTFCLLSEYDALPELGHACGHNLIAASALAAGLAVKAIMEQTAIPGRLIIMGTPGEETKGGKVIMLKEKAFAGIDACAMAHPFQVTGLDPGNLAVSRYDVTFIGRAAHAASEPEAGINALDAATLLFAGVNAWRQQLPATSKVHGIIAEGGTAPNIIPEKTSSLFYLRAINNHDRETMETRFENIARGAALMTGCDCQCRQIPYSYDANIPNAPLNALTLDTLKQLQLAPQAIGSRVSTDFANVTRRMPGVSFFFQATSAPASLHSRAFAQAAGREFAFEQAMRAAQVLSAIALAYLTDERLRQAVTADFEHVMARENGTK